MNEVIEINVVIEDKKNMRLKLDIFCEKPIKNRQKSGEMITKKIL